MVHTGIGNLGHLLIIISFITSLLAAFGYFKATNNKEIGKAPWISFSRVMFVVHGISIVGVVATLFAIIWNNYFEYHYAWSHASENLPNYYIIASFWEGQEGSFLLWLFWNTLLGLVIIKTNKKWEAPVMTVFAVVQAFLASMILGVVFGDLKIGSSPFLLLRDVLADPIFLINPDFVPADGTGLNPLLQNYWMVIHPPMTFLGFACTLIPFSFCIAGLWTGQYKEWVRPALPWTIFGAMILGTAIIMGGYWAYETLNFGGYWNWDPVENAVYVPWLVMVASIHTMITFKKSATALKTSIVLVISVFLLIVYASFLTRSGILGNASVHSFTDLGLSGQLLIYLLFFLFASIIFAVRAWKNIPSSEREASSYSREFWIFIGALTLCLMAFQVIIPTSFPVFNKIIEAFGGLSTLAQPTNQIEFYSEWQLWFAVAIAFLSGTGQFFFWKKMDKEKLVSSLTFPVLISLLLSAAIFVLAKISEPTYILILVAGMYSVVANGTILFQLLKSGSYKLVGGSVAHIGIAMMLIGIMFSEGYSKAISLNTMTISKEWTEEQNQTNIPLFLNEPTFMDRYQVTYRNELMEVNDIPGYVRKSNLVNTEDPYYKVTKQQVTVEDKVYADAGDTVYVQNPENFYYQVDYKDLENGDEFTLFPRIQVNPQMGDVVSPDIKKFFGRDIYSFVSVKPAFEEDIEWGELEEIQVKVGERFFVNDYVAEFNGLERIDQISFNDLGPDDVAVRANISVFAENGEKYIAQPIFIIQNGQIGKQADVIKEIASKITVESIDPDTGSVTLGLNTTQKDFIIMKALEKPHINILWIGTLVMIAGFIIATRRRYIEFIKVRDKGIE
ncbi:MAG: cytochrome c-type biogenesis protein CcmF [Roseivirga sp.]|jgi:cytochrome c-type biogenesis protein CcmF